MKDKTDYEREKEGCEELEFNQTSQRAYNQAIDDVIKELKNGN